MKKSFVLFFMVLALIVSSFAFASCTVGGNTGSGSHGGNASSESNFDNESPRESLTESISQSESENVSISADESESENESVIESESTTESERESEEVDPTDTKWFKFTLLDGGSGYSVSKCDDYDESTYPTKIVIPGIYKNMPVISVGAGAFFECGSLTSVTIPSSVISIGDLAFYNCGGLISVSIPSSVISIGDGAFFGCDSLTSVGIPGSVESIGGLPFLNCCSLEQIIVSEANTVYCSVNNCLIEKASRTLVAGCKTSIIPSDDSVTSIGDNAFYGCNEKLYTKADGVVYVDNWAVEVVDDTIISVNITPGTRGIADSAFLFCDSLTSVEIPNSVTSIGDWAFGYCRSLTSVVFNGTMAQWKDVEKGMSWLDGTKVTTIKCSDGEASIYE